MRLEIKPWNCCHALNLRKPANQPCQGFLNEILYMIKVHRCANLSAVKVGGQKKNCLPSALLEWAYDRKPNLQSKMLDLLSNLKIWHLIYLFTNPWAGIYLMWKSLARLICKLPNQEHGSIFRVCFPISKNPSFHSAYLIEVCILYIMTVTGHTAPRQ